MLMWRPLAVDEEFNYDDSDSGISSSTPGYAITLRMKNHRFCRCLRSFPVVYVAEHPFSPGLRWMHHEVSDHSARQFLLANPNLEPYLPEDFLWRNNESHLTERIRVSYGYIIRTESASEDSSV